MSSRNPLFAAVVLGALLLMFASSAASAAVWKHQGNNLSTPISLGLTGGEIFYVSGGSMACEFHATLTTSGGSTGKVTAYAVKNCLGTGSLSCSIAKTEARGLPWTVDVNVSSLSVTGIHLKRTIVEESLFCSYLVIDKTVPTTTWTPSNSLAIYDFSMEGEISGYKAIGSATVDSPNGGTYGIG